MTAAKKLVGISKIRATNVEALEFEITLAFDDGSLMTVATYFPAVEQMLPALSQIVTAVRESHRGTAQQVVAEDVRECIVEKDHWQDVVVLRFVSQNGAPYTFAIPPQGAREIAERLRIEAAKPHQVGQA
jgi:hypothetical protein